jgi:hypothetical protein
MNVFLKESRANSESAGVNEMRVIAYDRMKPGVTYGTIEPYLRQEVANVWRLWKAGIVRENYARADELGVVIIFELDSIEAAKRYTDDFPLTKAGFLEWFFISVQAPLPIEAVFDSQVDTKEPYDRTPTYAFRRGGQSHGKSFRPRDPLDPSRDLSSRTHRRSYIRHANRHRVPDFGWRTYIGACRFRPSGSAPGTLSCVLHSSHVAAE